MKRLFLLCTLTALFAVPAFAAHVERLPESAEYETVRSQTEEKIIQAVNKKGTQWGSSFTGSISTVDIDWNEVYKKYTLRSELFTNAKWDATAEELEQQMQPHWIVPLNVGGSEICVTLTKTEETGSWNIASIDAGGNTAEEWERQVNRVEEDQLVLLVDSVEKIDVPAVVYQEEMDVTAAVQLLERPVDRSIVMPIVTRSSDSDYEGEITVEKVSDLYADTPYALSELSRVLNNYDPPEENADPGSPLPLLGILAAAIVGMSCLGVATQKRA